MHTSKKLKVLVAAAVVMIGGAAVAFLVWYKKYYPVHRFGVVEEGVLYRSAQPDEAGWKRLRDLYGIRTVIDLREDKPNEPWAVLEKQFCTQNGIRYINLPIGPDRLTDDELRTIIETISDRQCQPVLVHCEHGKSRTGIAVAAYRVVVQGWSYEAALEESQEFKGHMEPGYAAYLKQLAEGEGGRLTKASTIGSSAQREYS